MRDIELLMDEVEEFLLSDFELDEEFATEGMAATIGSKLKSAIQWLMDQITNMYARLVKVIKRIFSRSDERKTKTNQAYARTAKDKKQETTVEENVDPDNEDEKPLVKDTTHTNSINILPASVSNELGNKTMVICESLTQMLSKLAFVKTASPSDKAVRDTKAFYRAASGLKKEGLITLKQKGLLYELNVPNLEKYGSQFTPHKAIADAQYSAADLPTMSANIDKLTKAKSLFNKTIDTAQGNLEKYKVSLQKYLGDNATDSDKGQRKLNVISNQMKSTLTVVLNYITNLGKISILLNSYVNTYVTNFNAVVDLHRTNG